jgi:hypothetical protein
VFFQSITVIAVAVDLRFIDFAVVVNAPNVFRDPIVWEIAEKSANCPLAQQLRRFGLQDGTLSVAK